MTETGVEKRPDTSRMTARHEWIEIRRLLDEYQPGDFRDWSGLDGKRQDLHYQELLEDIRANGLKAPLCIEEWGRGGEPYLANGHHRLAALIDLGFTHAPYCDDFTTSCGDDRDYY